MLDGKRDGILSVIDGSHHRISDVGSAVGRITTKGATGAARTPATTIVGESIWSLALRPFRHTLIKSYLKFLAASSALWRVGIAVRAVLPARSPAVILRRRHTGPGFA